MMSTTIASCRVGWHFSRTGGRRPASLVYQHIRKQRGHECLPTCSRSLTKERKAAITLELNSRAGEITHFKRKRMA